MFSTGITLVRQYDTLQSKFLVLDYYGATTPPRITSLFLRGSHHLSTPYHKLLHSVTKRDEYIGTQALV